MIQIFQIEPTLQDYWICFIFLNSLIYIGYYNMNKIKTISITWILALVFCVFFAKWETDYFSYYRGFYNLSKDYRDPLYYYIKVISLDSYYIWRTIVWGGALLLFYKTCKRLKLSANIVLCIFAVFFLMTFSYARASLSMASYFYGLSFFVCKPKKYLLGLIFIAFSYFAHRSALPLIIFTPFAFVNFNKKIIVFLLSCLPICFFVVSSLMNNFLNASFATGAFVDSAQHYAEFDRSDLNLNWKFELVTKLRNYSFYVLYVYILYRYFIKKDNIKISEEMKRYFAITTIILYFSSLFIFNTNAVGMTNIIGQRYAYFAGIPLCLLLAHLVQNGFCTKKMMKIVMFMAFVYMEGWLLGKIASLGYF